MLFIYNCISGVAGTYNPVSSGHFELTPSPRVILPVPPAPVLPSGPAREYHSDSAESLQEVQVSSSRSYRSNMSPHLPPLSSGSNYNNHNKPSRRRSSSDEEPVSYRLSSLHSLPSTAIGPAKPAVPPIDLSPFNDSDPEHLKSSRRKKKSRHKQQVSRI